MLSLGDTSLALLTALLAVAGVAIPALYQLFWPFQIGYLGVTEDERLMVSAVNRTDIPLWLDRITLEDRCLEDGWTPLRLWDPEGGSDASEGGGGPGAFTPRSQYSLPPGSSVLLVRPESLPPETLPAECDEPKLRVELMSGRRIKIPVRADEDLERFLAEWIVNEPEEKP